jgi:hypothetical protein
MARLLMNTAGQGTSSRPGKQPVGSPIRSRNLTFVGGIGGWCPERCPEGPGGVADIAVIEMQTERFGLLDAGHNRLRADSRLRAVLTIREGRVVSDSEGLSRTDWLKRVPYTNYR